MTLGEFKEKFAGLPDDTEILVDNGYKEEYFAPTDMDTYYNKYEKIIYIG